MAGFFVTGTDTGVGKTWVTAALMRALQQQGLRVVGMKPVATGCDWVNGELRNEDALLLQGQASCTLPYRQINPYAYQPPVSPDIAAKQAGLPVNIDEIAMLRLELAETVDAVLVEGIGGWLAPLDERNKVADMAVCIGLPVILVVGLKLGCINHALLTWEAIMRSGVAVGGWIANGCDSSFAYADETLATLEREMSSKTLAYFAPLPQNNLLRQINFNAESLAKILPRLWE